MTILQSLTLTHFLHDDRHENGTVIITTRASYQIISRSSTKPNYYINVFSYHGHTSPKCLFLQKEKERVRDKNYYPTTASRRGRLRWDLPVAVSQQGRRQRCTTKCSARRWESASGVLPLGEECSRRRYALPSRPSHHACPPPEAYEQDRGRLG